MTLRTRREILKTGAAVVAVAAVPAAAAEQIFIDGVPVADSATLDLEGIAAIEGPRPRFHTFVAEFFIEGDIEDGRVLHRIISGWVEGRDHPDFPSRVGINMSKVTPVA